MSDRADLWRDAAGFAAEKHAGQFRKDSRTPYIAHPFRVAMTVRHVFGVDDPIALAAARVILSPRDLPNFDMRTHGRHSTSPQPEPRYNQHRKPDD